jgi:hypothetical protein
MSVFQFQEIVRFLLPSSGLAQYVRLTRTTKAWFSTTPFFGAVVAIIFLREPLSHQLLLAGLLMAVGVCYTSPSTTNMSTFTNPWNTRIPTSMMRIINTNTTPTIRPASRTPMRTVTDG